MDGVLIDSVGLNWESYNQVLAQYGVQVPVEDIHKYMGKTLTDQIGELNRDYSIAIDVDHFARQTNQIKKELFSHTKPLSGVLDFLEILKNNNVATAVGTSNDRDTTKDRLMTAGLAGYFDHIITSDDVTNHKPHPDVYIECAKRLQAPPTQCIVVEDAPVGVQAAHNAGMVCIATASPYTQASQLEDAEMYVQTLASVQLRDLIKLIPAKP